MAKRYWKAEYGFGSTFEVEEIDLNEYHEKYETLSHEEAKHFVGQIMLEMARSWLTVEVK